MSNSLEGKRLLVVEEALKDHYGHWYEYVKAVVELNRREAAQVTVVSHAKTDRLIAAELGAAPLFERSNWDGVYAHPSAWRRYLRIVGHNWLVFRTMSRFLRRHGKVDCLFAPTVVIHHIWGWRLLLALEGRRIGRMVLLFRNNAGRYEPGSSTPIFKRSSAILKWALQSFSPALETGRASFATDSSRLAEEYRQLCGIAPEVYPSPRIAPYSTTKRALPGPGQPIVLSCLGPARFEKGIDILQQAIKDYLARGSARPVRFVIQWNLPIVDAAGLPYEPDPQLRADPRVEFLTGALDSEAYEALVAATDCMLLPYRRESYFARISGVAVEAVTAGIPLIYTNDTWTADLATAVGAGAGVDDGDIEGLSRAIEDMVDHYADYRTEAEAHRAEAQVAHSSHTFLTKLWGRA
jgi:glycosyltransferase involved in cell wall biosynthesis